MAPCAILRSLCTGPNRCGLESRCAVDIPEVAFRGTIRFLQYFTNNYNLLCVNELILEGYNENLTTIRL